MYKYDDGIHTAGLYTTQVRNHTHLALYTILCLFSVPVGCTLRVTLLPMLLRVCAAVCVSSQ